jgi:predicted Zn finger-like uncharacterized protein
MSLATRCNSCGTTFRVSEEQLRVSEGWVRCGRCEAVFNAAEQLIDIDAAAGSSPWAAAQRESPRQYHEAPEDNHSPTHWHRDPVDQDDRLPTDEESASPVDHERASGSEAAFDRRREPQLSAHEEDDVHWTPRPSPLRAAEHESPPEESQRSSKPATPNHRRSAHEESEAEHAADTHFMRRAQSRARWKQPAVVQGLALITAVLSLMLAMQWAHQDRDMLAARWPQAKGAIEAWCVLAGCELQAPQRIEDVIIDSASLTQIGRNSNAVKLTVNLRNKGQFLLATPSVDLRLTDTQGKLVLRRSLSPEDFQEANLSLEAGKELALQMVFQVKDLAYSGYHVEVFYP